MKYTKKLKKRMNLEIKAKGPFNFKYTLYKPSHFPTKLEFYNESNDIFYRTLRIDEKKLIGLKISNLFNISGDIGILLDIYSNLKITNRDLDKIRKHVIYSYGLEENIGEFYQYVYNDKKLQKVILRMNGMRNSCFENLFEILNISAMLQNTTVKRSEQMMDSMLSTFGDIVEYDDVKLHVFYTPKRLCKSSEGELRKLKLGYRAKYLISIADYFSEHPNLEKTLKKMPLEDARSELMKIKGIGPYSANLALFSYLKHPNYINFDVWNKKILSDFIFGNEDETQTKIESECEKSWGRFKGYSLLYIIEDLFVRKPELRYWRNKQEVIK
jgi:3-methyladenine DNA glycosylase/8-oxoguanine DNA glycosylase